MTPQQVQAAAILRSAGITPQTAVSRGQTLSNAAYIDPNDPRLKTITGADILAKEGDSFDRDLLASVIGGSPTLFSHDESSFGTVLSPRDYKRDISNYSVRYGDVDKTRHMYVLDDAGKLVANYARKISKPTLKDLGRGISIIGSAVLPFAGAGAGAALGKAIGLSGTAASAVGNAAISAGLAKAGGANTQQALLAGLFSGTTPVLRSIPQFAALPVPAQSAVTGAIRGTLTGQNPVKSAAQSAIGGTNFVQNAALNQLLRSLLGYQIARKG